MAKYIELNNSYIKEKQVQIEKLDLDKEAARAYFVEHVNLNTVFFHDLQEKLDYLVEHNYYEKSVLEQYTFEEIKAVYDVAYAEKFRFESYMAAFKFYNDYALLTDDKTRILERYEDRISIVALFLARGDAEKAKDLAGMMIRQEYQPATPTFLNAGRARRGELVSCFLTEVGDSLNDINMAESTAKQLSKIGGGVATSMTKIRAKGESIKDIAGVAKGVVGVMKSFDHAFRYADQMGQRPGSGAAYLDVFHADIFDFIETKKISADEDFRVKTLSIGVVISDKFIELARDNKPMYVFYPHTVYKEYGEYLDEMDMNVMYDKLVDNPNVRKRQVDPRKLLEKISIVRSESGYPYILFKDNANKVHANGNVGSIKFSNLCSEILQASIVSNYTDYGEEDEIGLDISCNLGSLNIVNVMKNRNIGKTVKLAMDALTAVSDLSSIANAPAVRKANRLMHSVGLGAMNLHGFLAQNGIPYESETAREFADMFFAIVNYWTLVRSNEIARETGEVYYGFDGSTYATGEYFDKYLPELPTIKSEKVAELFEGIEIPTEKDWIALKESVSMFGLYHAYRLAIAPTGSISYVQNSTASVMPVMEKVEQRTYGNSKTYYPMPGLSMCTWFLYKEAYNMDMFKVVDMIATIQRHVDQGISFTLFLNDTTTTRDLTRIDLYAHHKGIKTLYYARTRDTTQDECLSCSI